MSTSVLRHIRFAMLVMALTAPTWSACQAIGPFQIKPAFPHVVTDDDPLPQPTVASPNLSAGAFVGGCGKGRVSEPQTHGCRGPADIRRIAP
jgi:hypothetical protein